MRLPALASILAVCALLLAASAHAGGPDMLVGATEDSAQQPTLVLAKVQMDLAKLAGFNTIRLSTTWARGWTTLSPDAATRLQNAVAAADMDGIHPILSIYPRGSSQTPLTDADRAQFAQFAVAVTQLVPTVSEVIVGNEPNLNRFWLPQFDATGADVAATDFFQLLATTYDALKASNPKLTIGGIGLSPRGGDNPNSTRLTHSPTVFLQDLGEAYRESGRTTPIMDELAFHPYEDTSSVEPLVGTHPTTTTIALADYPKLVALLGEAFDGTGQLGSTLPILYDEFGVETQIPAAKASLYTGTEPTTTKPVTEATQASYYREALALAYCQPTVRGILLFHVSDENDLNRWQSGLYYVNGKPKASLPSVRAGIAAVHDSQIASCTGLAFTPTATVRRVATPDGSLRALVRCSVSCDFRLRLEKLPLGSLTTALPGQAAGGAPTGVTVPRIVRPGRYRFAVIAWTHGTTGKTTRAESVPFTVH
jgi:hypothetical protein